MGPNDEVCLCFHVTKRKLENFIRVEKVRRVGQLSECFGAGTGCGWCRPYLERLFAQTLEAGGAKTTEITAEEYARMREAYIRSGDRAAAALPDDFGTVTE
jgi:NAD(P)H-nitrite reductase large subunit